MCNASPVSVISESLIEKLSGRVFTDTKSSHAEYQSLIDRLYIPNERAFGRTLTALPLCMSETGFSTVRRYLLSESVHIQHGRTIAVSDALPAPPAQTESNHVASTAESAAASTTAAAANSKQSEPLKLGVVYACNYVLGPKPESFIRVSHIPTVANSDERIDSTTLHNSTQVPSGHALLSRDISAARTAGELRFTVMSVASSDSYVVRIEHLSRQSRFYEYPTRYSLSTLAPLLFPDKSKRRAVAKVMTLYRTNSWEKIGLDKKRAARQLEQWRSFGRPALIAVLTATAVLRWWFAAADKKR